MYLAEWYAALRTSTGLIFCFFTNKFVIDFIKIFFSFVCNSFFWRFLLFKHTTTIYLRSVPLVPAVLFIQRPKTSKHGFKAWLQSMAFAWLVFVKSIVCFQVPILEDWYRLLLFFRGVSMFRMGDVVDSRLKVKGVAGLRYVTCVISAAAH